jgi:F-type H+-transporting ATPase subunit gamma
MPNLKEVRNRITSVSSTQQITSAMKMVSAAKLRRAQDAVTRLRPYSAKLREILENLSASLDAAEGGQYSVKREPNKILIIAITSNRGLCGGFNANIIKLANRLMNEEFAAQHKKGNVKLVTIGKKGTDYFKKNPGLVISSHNEVFDNLTFESVSPVAQSIMGKFADAEFDKVIVLYNQFRNAAVQIPTNEDYLPVEPPKSANKSNQVDYIFEPEKNAIIQDLIPKSLKVQLFKALLDSLAAEHGARMTAMHKATDNAKELLKALKLSYNKARQAAITNEILEIVSGANALKG